MSNRSQCGSVVFQNIAVPVSELEVRASSELHGAGGRVMSRCSLRSCNHMNSVA